MLTNELQNAIDTVCYCCPYINDSMIDDKLTELAYPNGERIDPDKKYCSRCMVRHMYNLYSAMDKAGNDDLPCTAPEWQAIINY